MENLTPVPDSSADISRKYPLRTHGKGYPFRVDYMKESRRLVFSYPVKLNGNRRLRDIFTLAQIARVCRYLKNYFDISPFPLANSVDKLGKKNEKPGLGMAILSVSGNVTHGQTSSYLGPYLESLGIFKLVSELPAKWTLAVQPEDIEKIIEKHYH